MEKKKKYKTALTIAGSDPSGGAGIQADLKTFMANGCYGMSVITALTAQNTKGVKSVFKIPLNIFEEQLKAIISDIEIDAIKIGMLYDEEIIELLISYIKEYKLKKIVLDTVMISSSGRELLSVNAINILKKKLIPLVDIITPNLPEAETLLKIKIKNESDRKNAVYKLMDLGVGSVLLKGGHMNSDIISDYYYDSKIEKIKKMSVKKCVTVNTHGTGCTLSSAITSFLAKGYNLLESVFAAKEFLNSALINGKDYFLGQGHGPVNHSFKIL